jgi:hypothetical protein
MRLRMNLSKKEIIPVDMISYVYNMIWSMDDDYWKILVVYN